MEVIYSAVDKAMKTIYLMKESLESLMTYWKHLNIHCNPNLPVMGLRYWQGKKS